MAVTGRYFHFYLCLARLFILTLLICDVYASGFDRHRSRSYDKKKTIEDTTESPNPVPDQIALAAKNNQRRQDIRYGNLELNLIRPEKEPRLHAQITTKYTTSIIADHTPASSLEDAETAEEYVSKAIQRYGARLKEPIRIDPEPDVVNTGNTNTNDDAHNFYEISSTTEQPNDSQQHQQLSSQHPKQEDRSELDAQTQQQIEQQQQQQQQEQYQYFQTQQSKSVNSEGTANGGSAPVIEKDYANPTYQLYDEKLSYESSQPIDRTYRTRFEYEPDYQSSSSGTNSNTNSDKIRVSASTEIPKAEIMKQIEKSVIKYMQELEAEGKIITAPKEPKTYYKLMTVAGDEEKSTSTTTLRPKNFHSGTTPSYYSPYNGGDAYGVEKYIKYKHSPKSSYKQQTHYATGHTGSYQAREQAHQHDTSDPHESNVEFIYKIKSRAPIQTATVKTLSKPYTLPLKSSPADQFDHTSVLKNMEEFDLRHVVDAKDIDEDGLPTSDKSRLLATEYKNFQETSSQADFQGYSGYFAEPAPSQNEKESQNSGSNADDGYPLTNPYQYIIKKNRPLSQFEEIREQSRVNGKPTFSIKPGQKSLDYDAFTQKFNNNPESYGYIPTYKSERDREPLYPHKHVQRHALTKRGKRGGNHHSNSSKRHNSQKDAAASFALRPPPKS